MSKLAKKIEIDEVGNYLVAELSGVDLTPAGVMEGKKYGASIKLKFIRNEKVTKNVGGTDISTLKAVTQIVKINCTDDQLASLVKKYNEKIGHVILVKYVPGDNTAFVSEESDIKFL